MESDNDLSPGGRLWRTVGAASVDGDFEKRVLQSVGRRRKRATRLKALGATVIVGAAILIALPLVTRPGPMPPQSDPVVMAQAESFEETTAAILFGWDIEGADGVLNALDDGQDGAMNGAAERAS